MCFILFLNKMRMCYNGQVIVTCYTKVFISQLCSKYSIVACSRLVFALDSAATRSLSYRSSDQVSDVSVFIQNIYMEYKKNNWIAYHSPGVLTVNTLYSINL